METETSEGYRRYRRYFVGIDRLYQTKKAQTYTGIVLSILAVAFFLFFAIRPTFVTIAGLFKEIKDKRTIAEQLEEKINTLNSAQLEYQRVESSFFLLDQALPVQADVSFLIRQLEALARKDNVDLGVLQLGTTTLKGEPITVKASKTQKTEEGQEDAQGANFSLAIKGNYQQVKTFLDDMSRLRRLALVEAFAFQAGKEETELILTLNAKAYYLTNKQ